MATKIETLKKPNGDQVLPRTRAKAVSMESGTTVEAAILDIKALIGEAKIADQIANAVENATKDLATEKYVDAKIAGIPKTEIDNSLTKEGQAADAKAVGDAIGNIEPSLEVIIAIQETLIGGDGG